ncbi:MAG: DUF1553 domain-containing protein [Pirellulales bacterium]
MPRFVVGLVGCWCLALLVGVASAQPPTPSATPAPRFNRDIRPILSDLCFHCHGPDQAQRKADLRLDDEASTIGTVDSPRVVVRGRPGESELLKRLTSNDPDVRMPPPSSGRQATPEQIDSIRRWIAAGAPWEGHWAFQPPRKPPLPALPLFDSALIASDRAPRSAIDVFIQRELPAHRLAPSPAAPRTTLLRRLAFDLTGLPPTLDRLDEFLADDGPDAYQRQVDRYLAAPEYGERFGVRWLDAARYADTSGYQSDGPRYMWRWRDWVLESLNHDLPFNQFTIEQLAGDLLPSPTLNQRIATGFHRNHRGNSEGGIIPEEYAVEYVVDRVDTTGAVWLGLTLGCARCHEHKFDPISQREYYQLFAYFNNVPEQGRAIKEGNSPPFIKAPTPLEAEQLQSLDQQLAAADARVASLEPRRAAEQAQWERSADGAASIPAARQTGFRDDQLVVHHGLNDAADAANNRVAAVAGPVGDAWRFHGAGAVELGDVGGFGYLEPFSISIWVRPERDHGGTLVSKMTDVPQGDGYSLVLQQGKLQLNFVKRWLDDALRLESAEPLAADAWQHLLVVYDGTRGAAGVQLYVDGRPRRLVTLLDGLNQTFANKEPLRLGGGGGAASHFHGQLDELRIYRGALRSTDAQRLAAAKSLAQILATRPDQRTPGEAGKLFDEHLRHHASAEVRDAYAAREALQTRRAELLARISTVMVMEEMPTPRPTFVLRRGEYDKPGDAVSPGVPPSLGSLPENAPPHRLALAQWLVAPTQPLTARVAVNRLWQMLFGVGIVKTVEDFGSQGSPPSHPELLDWLACEFQDRDAWSLKQLTRDVVSSHSYRQSSRTTAESTAIDPENRWLARGPRFRLPAEAIRDQALAASGLLVRRIGGPSVKPYQPADLWKELATDTVYDQSHGGDLYRRTLYTYWKRTVAPPTLVTFDAAGREACVVRETRTNTPLQALALLNEVTFVEAARQLAQRVLVDLDVPADDDARLSQLFRLATARMPTATERQVLLAGLDAHRKRFQADGVAAAALLEQGESPRDERLDVRELAAWTTLASIVLNLDEAVTKD